MAKATDRALDFAHAIDTKFAGMPNNTHSVAVIAGKVYDKIIIESHGQRSVHAFVERKSGDLIKAAGWNAPQRNADKTLAVRYHLNTPSGFHTAVEAADPFGSYLYVK